ncbi:MAG: hypothetical protein OEX11_07540 [Nitrosomonas sp.]|nr:hypothetical protein [Nitrosomonas sp.]
MKFTLIFAALLAFALVACGGPSAPESPVNSENYGTTHEGQPAEGRNALPE